MPDHAENLNKWRDLADDKVAGGLIISDVTEAFEIKGFRVIS